MSQKDFIDNLFEYCEISEREALLIWDDDNLRIMYIDLLKYVYHANN